MRCRWDISPGAFGKTPMEYYSVFFVRRSLVTIVPGQQRNRDPQSIFFFATLMGIGAKGEASKAQRLILSKSKPGVSKAPEAHCAEMPKSIQLRAFGGTGEPFGRLFFRMGQRACSTCLIERDPVRGKRWHCTAEGKEPKSTYRYVAYSSSMKRSRLRSDETKRLRKKNIYIFFPPLHIPIAFLPFGNIVRKSSSRQGRRPFFGS